MDVYYLMVVIFCIAMMALSFSYYRKNKELKKKIELMHISANGDVETYRETSVKDGAWGISDISVKTHSNDNSGNRVARILLKYLLNNFSSRGKKYETKWAKTEKKFQFYFDSEMRSFVYIQGNHPAVVDGSFEKWLERVDNFEKENS